LAPIKFEKEDIKEKLEGRSIHLLLKAWEKISGQITYHAGNQTKKVFALGMLSQPVLSAY